MDAIYRTLTAGRIPDGNAKWELISRLGPMEPVKPVFLQRIGLSMAQATAVVDQNGTSHCQRPVTRPEPRPALTSSQESATLNAPLNAHC